MNVVLAFGVGVVIGYLDPVVLIQKTVTFCNASVFPKLTEWRNEWRKKGTDIKDVPAPAGDWTYTELKVEKEEVPSAEE